MKRPLLAGIRLAHRLLCSQPLQARISIYFHQLDRENWDEFRACILYFKELGYRTVSPSQFVTAKDDDRCLFVSFDDNFQSWHQALPLMRDLEITATFYVNSLPFRDVQERAEIERYVRRLRLPAGYMTLTRAELRAIRADGHTIGCHSHSHFVLANLPSELWDSEILGSKYAIEEILDDQISDFSWPYGMRRHFSEDLRRYCASIGFTTIANAIPGCQSIAGKAPLDIYRTDWQFGASIEQNLANLCIEGRLYAQLTGRSVIG